MSQGAARVSPTTSTTFAELVWPARTGRGTVVRAVILALLGSCLLTVAAKINVPGPVPISLQSLAVMLLGAVLGMPLAVASVAIYLGEGAAGLAVFAGTPPAAPGPAYLLGPSGGFLGGFLLAAAIVGFAADRGAIRKPVLFGFVLVGAELMLLVAGWAWIAFALPGTGGQAGLGALRAFDIAIRPFLLGDAVKLALAVVAFPTVYDTLSRLVRR